MPRSLKYPPAHPSAPVVPAAPSLAFAAAVVERLTPRDRWLLRLHMAKLTVWVPARNAPKPGSEHKRSDRFAPEEKWRRKV